MTLLEWIGFYFLHYICGVGYIISSIIMFVLISGLGLVVYKKAIFKHSNMNLRTEIVAIYTLNIVGILLNTLILWFLVEFVAFNVMVGKIIASGLVAFYSFWARKNFIYKK